MASYRRVFNVFAGLLGGGSDCGLRIRQESCVCPRSILRLALA